METEAILNKKLTALGYTRQEAIDNPDEIYPIPSPPYPSGRSYHLLSGRKIALVVDSNKEIVCELSIKSVFDALRIYTPEIIDEAPTETVFRYPTNDGWITADADPSGKHSIQTLRSKKGTYTTHLTRQNTGVVLLNQVIVRRFEYPAELDEKDDKYRLPGAVVEQAYFIWDESGLTPDAPEGEQTV